MDKTRTKVTIAGQEFRLSGDGSEDYIRGLAEYLNKKIEEIQRSNPSVSTGNCVILAALQVTDELKQLRTDYDALDSRIKELCEMPRSNAPAAPVKRPFETRQRERVTTE